MIITNLRTEDNNGRKRVAATVVWENCERREQELFYETDAEFADSLWCNPHAFLIPCTISALRFGEERVFMDEEACPELEDGLFKIMSWFRHWYDWYGPEKKLVRLDTKKRACIAVSDSSKRTGFLYSGGIDCLATLRHNRLHFSPHELGYIEDGLIVCGAESASITEEAFRHFRDSIMHLAEESDLTVITVYTNMRELEPGITEDFRSFWSDEYEMAAFSGVAHAFSKRFTRFTVSSTYDIPNLVPNSSHPLIDASYSSCDLRIRHFGETMSRLEKTKLVAEWDSALQGMRVCNRAKIHYKPGMLNCGRCEKCFYTMMGLFALGALEKSKAFPVQQITARDFLSAVGHSRFTEIPFYNELVTPLRDMGREDLVRAMKLVKIKYRAFEWSSHLKQIIKRLDRIHLKGKLRNVVRSCRRKDV